MTTDVIMKALDKIESNIDENAKKAKGEFETLGKVTQETQDALDKLGKMQLEQAERLQKMEQATSKQKDDAPPANESIGDKFTRDPKFKAWLDGAVQKLRIEVPTSSAKLKNTILTTTGGQLVQPLRLPGVIPGPARNLVLEQHLSSRDTTATSVEYTREDTFTNNAAEVAEGAQKPESSITFTLVNTPVTTVAHWIKISRQLSMDAPALAAYIDTRMRYGVNKRVEDQLVSGNGVGANIGGLFKTGNFTAHGYTDSALATGIGAGNKKLKLLRRVIADLATSDYPADIILLNPSDWADIELITDSQGKYIVGNPLGTTDQVLWKVPVVPSNAIPVGQFLVMSSMAATVYNREGMVVDMSESDADNFTKNLITIRAERRLMLAVELPAAIRGGALTPS